eukprot:GHVT01023971.1.p1 GENE.GHVT01023971.1~~GHVT01023971.1.p1  ORF type:complete len:126 (-),score=31.09 GHVT01023971.1:290-667(-)
MRRCGEECFAMRDSIRRELPLLAMREERQAAASEATRRTGEGSEGGGAGRRPAAAVLQAGPHPLAVPGRGRPNGINSWMVGPPPNFMEMHGKSFAWLAMSLAAIWEMGPRGSGDDRSKEGAKKNH